MWFTSRLSWETIERAAFAKHPEVLARGDALVRPPRRSFLHFVWAAPIAIVYFALYLSPIWGLAPVYSGPIARAAPDPIPEQDIPVSGVMFAIAGGFMLVSFVHWLVSGLRKNGFYQIQAGLVLVLGAITALRVTVLGQAADVPDLQRWLSFIGIAMAIAATFLVTHLVVQLRRKSASSRGPDDAETVVKAPPPLPLAELTQRKRWATALSDEDQQRVHSDVLAAIDDLERRKVITPAAAGVARDADFGDLAAHMSRVSRAN